ncbi:MAG: methionine--tRNA ligase, partial [Coprococcus comes]|nr:methionine--tRNA ligase [Coprococcus comes]
KFIRTTDDYHEKEVQKIFKKLYDQGDIYKGHYEGMYCTPCESFFTESQLVDGKCPDCGRPVQPAKEEAYFFKMSKYADRLIEYINTHPEFIQPVARKNEMMNNFLLPGLQDLCVSRTSFKWGIPVDFDPKHVVYVWLDALTNYITGIGYHCDGESDEMFNKNWPADLHLIGKDIIRFHTIYWPIFLMALGLPLPKQVFGHPWLLQGDGKMSKSKGNVLYADELVDFFGVDAVRYFVLHEMPFENDGVISWELMVERLNSDLANTLGNLVNRTISMTNKYFGGIVTNKGVTEEVDADLKAVTENTPKLVEAKMEELRVADAITEIFSLFKRCNKYIDETMPWALAKEEDKKDRLETVLWNLIQSISEGAKLLESFMPETAEKILAQLGGGHVVEKPEILFQRLDLEEVMKKVEELHPKVKEEKEEEEEGIDIEAKPEITFEDFEKMQFQVGEIISCEAVKKSKKLLCSQVKIGSQVKQIVSGIKAHYTPEEMVGKKVMVLVNLKPAKLAGVLSEGMLLCAEDADGNLALMTPEKKMPAGAEIC